ncbi:Dabb family protein [Gimesia sp.]|uniref:Dabb family protein n=1 Tax=Gimesia sp. TaxID=2024833 RepID=UPI003A946D99
MAKLTFLIYHVGKHPPLNEIDIEQQESHPVIEHTVTFRLTHPHGSAAETTFLAAAAALAEIQDVKDFVIRRQTSPKNQHTFGISMRFDTQEQYDFYSNHPAHRAFIQEHWLSSVSDFQEADFEPLESA